MTDITLSPLIAPSAGNANVLLVESGSLAGQRFVLPAAPAALLLGRERVCNVRFDPERDRVVGRTHARIEIRSHGIYLVDLNSANGTFRGDGSPVRGETLLRSGDRFQLGGEGGPWLSLSDGSSAAVHVSPTGSDVPTLMTPMVPRREAVTQPPAAEPQPSPSWPSRPGAVVAHSPVGALPAPAPRLPQEALPGQPTVPPRAAPYQSARLPALPEASPAVDPLMAQQQRDYRRQVSLIALLLVLACISGLALGLRDGQLDDSSEATGPQ